MHVSFLHSPSSLVIICIAPASLVMLFFSRPSCTSFPAPSPWSSFSFVFVVCSIPSNSYLNFNSLCAVQVFVKSLLRLLYRLSLCSTFHYVRILEGRILYWAFLSIVLQLANYFSGETPDFKEHLVCCFMYCIDILGTD
jgi:hypothetical protein